MADNLQLPRTYIRALFGLVEVFGAEERLPKKQITQLLGIQKADAVINDAAFLGLVAVERDTVQLTPSGKLFSSSSQRGQSSYVRTQLEKVPFVQVYLAHLASYGTTYHQNLFAQTLRDFTKTQWTWSTTDWRAKVLVNWLEFAQLLTRNYGTVSIWRQGVFDFERLGM